MSAIFSPSRTLPGSIPCGCWNFGFSRISFSGGDDGAPGLSIRLGQLTADSEFVISDYGALFTNGSFGWPAFLYTNIPEGGPGYPMGALGIRVAVNPWEWMTLQSAAFQGNVFAQNVNRHGFRWNLNSDQGYFWINEVQVRWNQGDDARELPGQAKFGAWFHTADFADPFFDEDGIPLADEHSSGNPQTHRWNYGFYWILDQMIYREPGKVEPDASLSKDGKPAASLETSTKEEPSKQGSAGLGALLLSRRIAILSASISRADWFTRASFQPVMKTRWAWASPTRS